MAESLGDALLRTTLGLQGLADQLPGDLTGCNYFVVYVKEIDLGAVLSALVGALGLWNAVASAPSVMCVDFAPRRHLEFSR